MFDRPPQIHTEKHLDQGNNHSCSNCCIQRDVICRLSRLTLTTHIYHQLPCEDSTDLSSMLIQAADTYLHVSTSAVNFVHTEERPSQNYNYGTGFKPACIDRDRRGSATNVNYWGCTLTVTKSPTDQSWRHQINNYTEYYSLGIGTSESHDILEYVGSGEHPIMVLVPKSIPSEIDYSASSFGSSSQCQFIRNSSCVLGQKTDEDENSRIAPYYFNCSVPDIPLQVSGKLSVYLEDLHQMNFHRLLEEYPPFNSTFLEITQGIIDQATNITDEEAKSIFKNPWHSLASMSLPDFPHEGAAFSTSDDRIFWYPDPNVIIFCTHTSMLFILQFPNRSVITNTSSVGCELYDTSRSYSGIEQETKQQ